MSDSPVFIYALWDPRSDRITYVGKSKNPTMRLKAYLHSESPLATTSPVMRWALELKRLGLQPRMTILEQCSATEWEDAERRWISHYRAENPSLLNVHAGGLSSGLVCITVGLRLTAEEHAALVTYCERENVTHAEAVRRGLRMLSR